MKEHCFFHFCCQLRFAQSSQLGNKRPSIILARLEKATVSTGDVAQMPVETLTLKYVLERKQNHSWKRVFHGDFNSKTRWMWCACSISVCVIEQQNAVLWTVVRSTTVQWHWLGCLAEETRHFTALSLLWFFLKETWGGLHQAAVKGKAILGTPEKNDLSPFEQWIVGSDWRNLSTCLSIAFSAKSGL